MLRVRLIHWNSTEAQRRAVLLENLGFEVDATPPLGPQWLRDLRNNPPDVVLIDLSRLPSQGRDFGLALRMQKTTRDIPLVFVGGELEKIDRVRETLPDAMYTNWEEIKQALQEAVEHPLQNPVFPQSLMDGYSGKPLVKKLGFKPGMRVGLCFAPEDFAQLLGALPDGAVLVDGISESCDMAIWFVRTAAELEGGMAGMARRSDYQNLWIAWPKKGASLTSDVSQSLVRATGLAHGWVDYKISSFNPTWSGLLFTRRKVRPARQVSSDKRQ